MRASKFFCVFLIVLLVSTPLLLLFPVVFGAELFSDGFEDNTLNAWDSTASSGATIGTGSNDAHHGTYHATLGGLDNNADYAYAQQAFSAQTDCYMRVYVRFSQDFTANNGVIALVVLGVPIASANWNIGLLRQAGGSYVWQLYNTITLRDTSDTFTMNPGQWYCVELYVHRNTSTGVVTGWVDGEEVLGYSGNTGSSDIDACRIETWMYSGDADPSVIDFDCVVVDTSYIGPEAPFFPYVQQTSDVDSSVDVGTHSNFTAQQYGPDGINDTLTEENTGGGTSVVFSDGFEDGTFGKWVTPTTWDDGDGAPSTYIGAPWTVWDGTYYATCDSNDDGDLITDDIDCSDATAIGVSFYFMNDDLDGTDYQVYFYDGSSYDLIQSIGGIDPEDTWFHWSTITTDSQYFKSNFRVEFHGAPGSGEVAFLDDVSVNKTTAGATNYRLDLEEQFTEVDTSENDYQMLCIVTGAFSGAEDLTVNIYNESSWHFVMNLTANTWNNASIAGYVNDTVEIQFVDGLQSSDSVENTWEKDACLLWFYNVTGGNEESVYSSMALTFALNHLGEWSFSVFDALPFQLALNGLAGLGKAFEGLLTFTLGFSGANTYAVLKPMQAPFSFTVNSGKAVDWLLQDIAVPFAFTLNGFFHSVIVNFLNVFGSVAFTLAFNFLGAFGFDGGFTALLTFASAGGKTATFDLAGLVAFVLGLGGGFGYTNLNFLNIFGSLPFTFSFTSLTNWLFSVFAQIPLTLAFNGAFSYLIGQTLINIVCSIPFQLFLKSLNSFTFMLFGSIPITTVFSGGNVLQVFLTFLGSMNVGFAFNMLKEFAFTIFSTIPLALTLSSLVNVSSFLTFLTFCGSILLNLAFAGEFPFGEWLTNQFNLWLIIGAILGSSLFGTLIYSVMRIRKREPEEYDED